MMMTPEEIQDALKRVRRSCGQDADIVLYRLRAINAALRKQTEEMRRRVVQHTENKLRQGEIDPETIKAIHAIGRRQGNIACQVAREHIRELNRR